MLPLAPIPLQLQPHLTHALGAATRLDLIRLLAFGGVLGAHLLPHLLLTTLAFLLQPLDDVDGAALGDFVGVVVRGGVGGDAVVRVLLVQTAEEEAACAGQRGGAG